DPLRPAIGDAQGLWRLPARLWGGPRSCGRLGRDGAGEELMTTGNVEEAPPVTVPCTLREFLGYFLRLGTFGFGGPIALAGYMQRDLVERRRWVSKQDYVEGLAFAQLCPGPLAAQLAMYLGWVRAGFLGATLVSIAFIGPAFVMVLALAAL